MDGDVYFAEHVIRDRLADAHERAKRGALLGDANPSSPGASGFWYRLLGLGRSLVKRRGRRTAGPRRPLGGGKLDDLHGETTGL